MPAKTSSSQNYNEKESIKICRFCKSFNIIRKGLRKTENRGSIQRYFCKSCKKKFVIDDGFFRMRNNPEKITNSLHLYFSGASLRKTQAHLAVFYPHNASYVSILKWIRKYSNLVTEFTDKLNLKVGEELMSDEMEYATKGQQTWFVDVLDTKTRYIVSSDFMRSRTLERLIHVLRNAKKRTGNQVKIITTDGLRGYPAVLRKSFGLHKIKGKTKIQHNIVIASERGFNHKIERFHNSVRERTKIFRGFHGSIESARSMMKGYIIYYNFCRKHQGINYYPYQLATDLVLGKNKWLDLIKLSNISKTLSDTI